MNPVPTRSRSPTATKPTPKPLQTDTKNSESGSKKGLAIGLSIGIVIVVAGAVIGVFLFFKWRGNRKLVEETERAEGLVEDVEAAKAWENDAVVEPVLNP
jgi:flagellar basal body-associated protein FliL